MFIVGLGGALTTHSSTERALNAALAMAERKGARTKRFDGAFLRRLPHYAPAAPRNAEETELIAALRAADAVIVATPAYHAGVSALVKNALDLVEDLVRDDRAYLDGVPVGCIVTAGGVQAAGQTLAALRMIVHALRGWPTPAGVALVNAASAFDSAGNCTALDASGQLELMVDQLMHFSRASARSVARVLS